MTTRGAIAFALLAAVPACADDPGPLDRETVSALARARGDAWGGAHTGFWILSIELVSCDCPLELETIGCFDTDVITGVTPSTEIVEGDGFMTMGAPLAAPAELAAFELSGAIDADGTFSLGHVSIGVGLGPDLFLVARLDGEFTGDPDDEQGGEAILTGQARTRVGGTLDGKSIACGGVLEVEGESPF